MTTNDSADLFWQNFPRHVFTGDGACRDEGDGYYIDNRPRRWRGNQRASGHRLGTAECRKVPVSHELVAEAAVAGYPHDIKSQGIYGPYVTLTGGTEETEELLRQELRQWVRKEIGRWQPDHPKWATGLPTFGQDHAPLPA